MGNYDAIIIGAGHNGLVAAAYLAKAGRRVLVLERRDQVGGAAVTEEIFPGFKVSTVADGGGYVSAKVRRDLKLDSHVETVQSDAVAFCPQPDGKQLTIWRDTEKTIQEIARFSKADAEAYPKFLDLMNAIAAVIGGIMEMTPPDLPEVKFKDIRAGVGLLGPVWKLGRKRIPELLRVMPMSTTDLLNEYFESGAVKGAIGANCVLGLSYGPMESGTALTLAIAWSQSGTGLFRSAGVVKGGIGALTAAMADAARGFGAEIRTGAAVAKIVVEDGKVTGVQLEAGEQLGAPVVVSAADVRSTFHNLVKPSSLNASFMNHVDCIKYRGSGTRIHLALRGLPEFASLSGSDAAARLRGPIQIAPSLEYIEQAYDCTKYGEYADRPYLDMLIPSLSDPSLAPDGQHILSITAKFGPYQLGEGSWDERKEAFADVAIDTLAEYAPNIKDLIPQRAVISPLDLERTYGLPEGNPNHGEMTLDQFMHMRPIPGFARYRMPIGGLYLCSAGTHPGGGVTGIPGHNAAREILNDHK
ncbi:MAG: NAD(P)/FAD-dependent oxidoreductase [Myxococcales bacterium]|nr:NAD(P)/FAD-dependent oxidoreductase [Myxococcales bacterium]